MSYQVKKDKTYQVVEKDTDLVVFEANSERTARSMCRSLNLGSGFAGFTPTFFALPQKETAPSKG